MRMLNPTPPPVFIIPSNTPRTRRGPDSRGIRICFAELGRSCSLDTGYLIFTDGSAYDYGPGSKDGIEDLCASLQRGRQFNFGVRRSRGGYVKGFTPPPDYETIYSFPPYAGTQPAACVIGKPDWTLTDWVVLANSPQPGQSFAWSLNPGVGQTEIFTYSAAGGTFTGSAHWQGTLSYTGPMTASQLDFVITGLSVNTFWNVALTVGQDGTSIAFTNPHASGNTAINLPFTVADTLGVASSLTVDVVISVVSFAADGASPWSTTPSNV